jgi:DNA-binding transcriptional regulator YiaG
MKPEELRARRLALGYRALPFAAAIGVCYQTLWKWETGKRPIPLMLSRLLDLMEKTADPVVDAEFP